MSSAAAPPDLEAQTSPAVPPYPPDRDATDQAGDGAQTRPQEQSDGRNEIESQNGPSQVQGQPSSESSLLSTSRTAKPRAKRGKYISNACNECKRRKSKCNGQRPCGRCVQHSLECIYSTSRTAKSDTSTQSIRSLSNQVAELQGNLEQLRNGQQQSFVSAARQNDEMDLAPAATLSRPLSQHTTQTGPRSDVIEGSIHTHTTPSSITPSSMGQPRQPAVSYTFNLELARQHLRAQGSRTGGDSDSADALRPSDCTRQGTPAAAPATWDFSGSSIDPLWLIDKQEALRLCDVYEEEIGISYPFLSVQALVDKAHTLYDAMEAGSRNGFAFSSLPGPTVIDGDDLDILRLAMSTALTIETSGASELGNALFAKAQETTAGKIWQATSLKSIALYTLMAIHAFLSGDDLQAWRLIGIPARWCLELGLHQATTYSTKFKQASERRMAIRLFWSIHTLDRRWSFGAGLPFVIQPNDIDPNLPMPDSEVPYLQAMVTYNRIGAKVWATLYNSSSTASTDDVDFLHYSIDRWYRDVPPEMKLQPDDDASAAPPPGRGLHRLRILLYLRACQMKILLHQSVLHSVSRFTTDASQVRLLVNIAEDMIQTLDNLNKTTDIYQTQQVCFNHFLISALGVVFLAVAFDPAVYRGVVHSEFNMALDLVRGFSTRSYVSRRLWRMIRGLRQAGVRLGITNQQLEEGTAKQPPPNPAWMPSPPLLASPESQSGPSHASEAWLSGGMASDRGDGFMMPLSGSQMTLTLNDLLAAMESENGSWEDLAPSGEALQDKDIEGSFDHGGDFPRIDFSQMWDTFL